MNNSEYVLYLIVQGIINLNFNALLTLEEIIILSRINKFQYEQISKSLPLFINLLGYDNLPTNTYFRKYRRGKNYHDDNIRGRSCEREIDEPFILNSKEKVLSLYSIDYDYDNDTSNKIEAIKRFIMKIADNKSYTFINEIYKTRHGCGIDFIICNSGQCHIFFDEISIWELTPNQYRIDSNDKNKEVLVMTITCETLSSLLNLLYHYKLQFILDSVKREYVNF